MTEADLQNSLRDLARRFGWLTYHTHDSRRSDPGFPDTVLTRGGRLIFAELKSDKGRLRPEQMAWLCALRETCDVLHPSRQVQVFVWRPRDWDAIVEVLR